MNAELLLTNWALALAAALVVVILLIYFARLMLASAPAQLRQVRKKMARERVRLRKAEAAVATSERRLRSLRQEVDNVKPRLVQEAAEALSDAKALARIANDQVLIAENHVRRVILQEFAPAKQQRLRAKYLPDSPPDKRPFSF
jgi:septal ring factor EnvC (AmiA/AmiB activator)